MGEQPVADRDAGAAVVEYVLVSVLLILVLLAVAQVALLVHARDILVADAAEGARTAALRDSTLHAGETDCALLVRQSLSSLVSGAAPCSATRLTGTPQLVDMRVTATVPMTVLPFAHIHLDVHAHAVVEPVA